MVDQTEAVPPVKTPLVIAVTGHRPDKLGGYKLPNPTYIHVMQELRKAFEYYKPDFVIVGMAIGTDQWAAELCLTMGIRFIAAIPFDGQDGKWPPHVRSKYQWLLSRAHQACVISPGPYDGKKMFLRDKWMVDYSQLLVAVWNGSEGGTAITVAYAKSVDKPIYFVPVDPPAVPTVAPPQYVVQAQIVGNKPQALVAEEKQEAAKPFHRKVDLG